MEKSFIILKIIIWRSNEHFSFQCRRIKTIGDKIWGWKIVFKKKKCNEEYKQFYRCSFDNSALRTGVQEGPKVIWSGILTVFIGAHGNSVLDMLPPDYGQWSQQGLGKISSVWQEMGISFLSRITFCCLKYPVMCDTWVSQ